MTIPNFNNNHYPRNRHLKTPNFNLINFEKVNTIGKCHFIAKMFFLKNVN